MSSTANAVRRADTILAPRLAWRAWSSKQALLWISIGGFFVAVVAVRWILRSQYLFDLDSILYARALDNFDLRIQQPPLPGYILYIVLGRLARAALGDPNLSLQAISAVLGILLPGALFGLGRQVGGARTGVLAALLGLTGPVFWYQASFASPRVAEGFLAALVVWVGIRHRLRGEGWSFWLLALLVAISGGVRQQILLYFVPFCVWATWKDSLLRRFAGALVAGLLVAAWLIPTIIAAGGMDQYRALNNVQWQQFVVDQTGVVYAGSLRDGLLRLVENSSRILLYTLFACPLIAFAVAIGLATGRNTRGRLAPPTLAYQGLLAASVPPVLFFAFIHIQQIGHILGLAPFIIVMAAHAISIGSRSRITYVVAAATIAANVLFVGFAPSRLINGRVGTPTVAALRERDAFISATIATLHQGTPDDTVAIASPLAYGFIEEYVPGYRYFLMPGLFAPSDSVVLTNGFQPVPSSVAVSPGTVLMPEDARRFVTVGYEFDISHMLQGTDTVLRPQPAVPSVAVLQSSGPAVAHYATGRLRFTPATEAAAQGQPA